MSLQALLTSPAAMGSSFTIEHKKYLPSAVLFTLLAMAALAGHFILVVNLYALGFVWIIGVALLSYFLRSEFLLALLITALFLQNVFISILSPQIKDMDYFALMLATSFVLIAMAAAVSLPLWMRVRSILPADSRKLLYGLIFLFAIIVVYTGLGAVSANLNSALVYARIYLSGGMLLAVGVALGFYASLGYIMNVVRLMAFILIVWGIAEFAFTYELYDFFHVVEYFNLKLTRALDPTLFKGIGEMIDFKNSSYLNLSGTFGLDFFLLRPNGVNLHPISYAYALSFCALVCFICRNKFLMAGCFILAVLVGAKGPLIIMVMSLLMYVLYINLRKQKRLMFVALATAMGLYLFVGLIYGNFTRDYHVIGFLGGVKGFLGNPLGHGIGVGGNLSSLAKAETNFQAFQNYGANFALESAFGVMLYQIGIGTVIFCLFYWRLWQSVWKATQFFGSEPRLVIIPFSLAFLFVNCIFQEEALSPSGWGLWLLFCGLLLAKYWKQLALQKD